MPHDFEPHVVAAVLRHMNEDHAADNLLIARAFAEPESLVGSAVQSAAMSGFDGDGGTWEVVRDGETSELRVPWPGGPIAERRDVRREIVALYDAACALLSVEPRPHD